MYGWRLLAGTLLAGLLLLPGCGQRNDIVELRGETMGTGFSVKLPAPVPAAARERLQQLIERRLKALNGQMSTYLPDSDLQRFNAAHSIDWLPQARCLGIMNRS